ncbi:competence type IV pilus assembly protein ComGB [Oceanobacillus caeni]|uniref:Chromosome partitioning protein ParA n=1 Tax=Oceanobacillus caeni TaxID=405946 RepID=A0ABR5MGP4_9BACI|nr:MULTISPECIES: competence type IV pilus assembly protein ComGB [Bacillaceae]KPH71781.1 chromosome partitioning protein ParA [Oceanobacillus caeni]MBU8789844.1 type II secretion system F family protein [Oceanobacillus caeni]MCR1834953.1 competence type IV pilus assembly protein ComGB [Oceanobacillus caeni]
MDLSLKKLYLNYRLRPNNELQLRFLKRLSRLLKNGYPILTALEKIKWDSHLSTYATKIIDSLKNGETIDQAFENVHFHPTITSYLFFVRANNDLEGNLEKAIQMFQQRITHTKKFKQIIRYPLILIFIFSTLLFFIKESVLPTFVEIFDSNYHSNSSIHYTVTLIDFVTTFIIISILVFSFCFILWYFIQQKLSIQKQLKIYLKIPLYRYYLKIQTSYFFASHFSSLLKTGMSFKEILQHMANQPKLPIISYYSTLLTNELSQGIHLSFVLSQLHLLDKHLISIFQQDTDMEALEMDLSVYAELLMEDIEAKTLKILTWVQPIFLIIIGGLIIFIYISLMWPMFQLIKTV